MLDPSKESFTLAIVRSLFPSITRPGSIPRILGSISDTDVSLARKTKSALGLYYSLDAKKAKAANAAEFSFIDFNGNVGLRLSDKTSITLLAIHRLSQPGTDNPVQPANCDIGRFDPSLNQTTTNGGNGYYRILRLIDSEPATIFNCVLPDDQFDSTKCVSGQFMSYVNRSTSPIISRYNVAFSVTEHGRLFVAVSFIKSVCGKRVRLASEYLNFIDELCDRPVR